MPLIIMHSHCNIFLCCSGKNKKIYLSIYIGVRSGVLATLAACGAEGPRFESPPGRLGVVTGRWSGAAPTLTLACPIASGARVPGRIG